MIRVEQLTKEYGAWLAVDQIDFEINKGEVVGLLGPNGAGKTTTIRMLATYLTPTSGRAWVAGHDVLDEPLEVRKKIGYLPESAPLHNEMRVGEYLSFRARLRDIPRSKRGTAIDQALERCSVQDRRDFPISTLSMGYRQRVALADAMLHDPEILILDEPTRGLDPIQTLEIRRLIRDLGQSHLVMLSTHILSEVEVVCDRAIAIARGRIVLDERLNSPNSQKGQTLRLEIRGPANEDEASRVFAGFLGVPLKDKADLVVTRQGHWFEIQAPYDPNQDQREELVRAIHKRDWGLRSLEVHRSSLEERFIKAVTSAPVSATARPHEETAAPNTTGVG